MFVLAVVATLHPRTVCYARELRAQGSSLQATVDIGLELLLLLTYILFLVLTPIIVAAMTVARCFSTERSQRREGSV